MTQDERDSAWVKAEHLKVVKILESMPDAKLYEIVAELVRLGYDVGWD